MADLSVQAVVIPSGDPHHSEYAPACFALRGFISGFHGSAGTVVVSEDHAGLWTDSRYFLAAETALEGTEFTLHRERTAGVLPYQQWLAKNLPAGARVGLDLALFSITEVERFAEAFAQRGIVIVDTPRLSEMVWRDRPTLPEEEVWPLETRFTGSSATEKILSLRKALEERGCQSHVVTALDDIAWILNLRGSDVAYNPVFLSFLVITIDAVVLYTNQTRLNAAARHALNEIGAVVKRYEEFDGDLTEIRAEVLIDPQRVSERVRRQLTGAKIVYGRQPSTWMKSRKNGRELSCIRQAMVRDGVAMVRFLAWLDRTMAGGERPTEWDVAQVLQALRAKDERYISDSFNYISGYGPNAAIPHYTVEKDSARSLRPQGFYLIDSGAQYRDGTTDITRTVALGEPTKEEKADYTYVLKGHISLARLQFPVGAAGRDIDAIARQPLWNAGRNFGHGTGHGVGFVLNVHEGPQRIAFGSNEVALEEGMYISNEPGLYRAERYGIRIENLIVVEKGPTSVFGDFFQFETVTLCPIDTKPVAKELLDTGELAWLNDYNRRVYQALAPLLNDEDRSWLKRVTTAV